MEFEGKSAVKLSSVCVLKGTLVTAEYTLTEMT